jgi:hypothetical protein
VSERTIAELIESLRGMAKECRHPSEHQRRETLLQSADELENFLNIENAESEF